MASYLSCCLAPSLRLLLRTGLIFLNLTSQACHEASLCIIFQRISITVRDREGLRRDVDALIEALEGTNSFRYIQQITIKGALRLKSKKNEGYATRTPYLAYTGLSEILDEEPISYNGMYAVYDESVIEKSSEEDMAWAPMVNLLQAQLPLKDLVYDCQSQFPPSLLTTLHEQHPQCRLHHLTFKFRTLFWGVPYPYEMELATSPSLYRVKAICAQRDSDGDDDFNLDAIMELTTGLAPNIKEVVILHFFPGGSGRSRRPLGTFQGLPGFTHGKKGSLKSLSLKGCTRLRTPTVVQNWARHIDFTGLQHLTLGGYLDSTGCGLSGETMEWLAQTQSFPQVKTLGVWLTRDDLWLERPRYSEQAVSFFRSFDSLEQLSIDGPIDSKILDNVLYHHGQTLRKLSFRPYEDNLSMSNARERLDIPFRFTKDRVLQIEAQCPVLEELAIPVKRNNSSASEAEIYRCFGTMKRLRSLFLILDCSDWRIYRDPAYARDFDEEDQKLVDREHFPFFKRGNLKEAFINCAVDETLANSIWKVVSENKSGRQLERLKLWPTGAGEYGNSTGPAHTFACLARHLARSWLFERVPRDDTDDFTVRELGRETRKALNEGDAGYLNYGHNPEIWEVFRALWPAKKGSKDFSDDWSGVPL
ncbi:hypothetical protein M409DRAFT_64857 [Zasmidium cellare ATCC 36951]|uniref:F-box domain-containing protein n=1 Tax=Zasmidium cellare ATCC 36951 TaxID=1080233 RepID=A0A6A6CS23_ZASCE|nr:uncharacterized protein M409DRAFT_64857 [Zasmidium cellare ATCC 36951]KAF2169875.1 hypothetical protein M409DRAFT_64857 [Zasmidium cellare ATCC 36951]